MSQIQDTFEIGSWITVNKRRYIIAEHSSYPINGGISVHINAVGYENCAPKVMTFSKLPLPKKAKRKPKKR